MYEYLKWLFLFLAIPLAIIWIYYFKILKKYKKTFIAVIIGSLIFGIPWDYMAIKEKLWYFAEQKILGIWIAGLPLEEHLFILLFGLLVSSTTLILKGEKKNE